MRVKPVRYAIGALLATMAWGQTPAGQSVSQVFHFTYTQSPKELQEITNAIRTIGQIAQVSPDYDAKTLTVSGTQGQVAIAAWLLSEMDQPLSANPVTREFRPAGSTNDVVRILYLTHGQGPPALQEIVNAVRTIPEMTKVFPYSAQNAVVIRGTDSQAAMAESLFHQLDLPAGVQPVQNPAAHQYVTPGATNDVVQVLFLTHAQSAQGFQEIVNTLRVIPELTKVFPCTATGAIALRGPAATVSLATWLFNQLDQPAGGQPQFQMPGGADDVTKVYYLSPNTTAQGLQSIVNAVRTTMNRRVFPNTALNALTLRGTATQVAAADLLIKQMDKP